MKGYTIFSWVILSLLGLTSIPLQAFSGLQFENKNWLLVCDNTGTCRAVGYSAIYESDLCVGLEREPDEECYSDLPLAVKFTRTAGPNTSIIGEVFWGETDTPPNNVTLYINSNDWGDRNWVEGFKNLGSIEKNRLTERQVNAILSVVKRNTMYNFNYSNNKEGPKGESYLSDRGATAVFRKMDEYQGRVGTPSAVVDKGTKLESSVLPAIEKPIVVNRAAKGELEELSGHDVRHLMISELLSYTHTKSSSRYNNITEAPYYCANYISESRLYLADLGNDNYLVAADCWQAAYNFSRIFWHIDSNRSINAIDLEVNDYADGQLFSFFKGRAVGDCWVRSSSIFNGQKFVSVESGTSGLCREIPWGVGFMPYKTAQVQDQPAKPSTPNIFRPLTQIQNIVSTKDAFTALRKDGTLFSWGDLAVDYNGFANWSSLRNVTAISSTSSAFAALMHDGTVVTWGDKASGGDSSFIKDKLVDIVNVSSSDDVFTATQKDGSFISWGRGFNYDYSTEISKVVRSHVQSHSVYAGLRSDGSVVTWGDKGVHENKAIVLTEVQDIFSTQSSFAALLKDSSVVSWRYNVEKPDSQHKNVKQLFRSQNAYSALKHDGSIITWKDNDSTSAEVISGNFIDLTATKQAFVALSDSKTVMAWGDEHVGGIIPPELSAKLKDIKAVYSTDYSFAALREDGLLFFWGHLSHIPPQENVKAVYPSSRAFTVLKHDGTVQTWGDVTFTG